MKPVLLILCQTSILCQSQPPFSPFEFLGNLFKPAHSWTSSRQAKKLRSSGTRTAKPFTPHLPISPSFSASQVCIPFAVWFKYVNLLPLGGTNSHQILRQTLSRFNEDIGKNWQLSELPSDKTISSFNILQTNCNANLHQIYYNNRDIKGNPRSDNLQ